MTPADDAATPATPRMAAAVIALRDGEDGMEVLVGQRTSAARFMGGFWVFPGGRVEPSDGDGDEGYRRGAARELQEEAGLVVAPDELVPFDRWVTPEPFPRRFDTVFYVVAAPPDATVTIDGEEIVDSRWATPDRLLEDAESAVTTLAFPTLRQLEKLREWRTVAEALAACAGAAPEAVTPRLGEADDGEQVLVVPGPDGAPRNFRTSELLPGEGGVVPPPGPEDPPR